MTPGFVNEVCCILHGNRIWIVEEYGLSRLRKKRCSGMVLQQSATGPADPRKNETACVFLPEGVLTLAQDKRSAILGKHRLWPHSPTGTVQNSYAEHVSTRSATCNPHGKQF